MQRNAYQNGQPPSSDPRKTQEVATIAAGVLAAELLRVVAEATVLLPVFAEGELRAAFAGAADTSAATAARWGFL
jgi:hypothetical protein